MRSARSQLVMSILVLSVMVVSLLVMMYMLLWPINVLQVHKVELITPQVHPGGRLEYRMTYSKYMKITGDVTKQLVGVEGNKAVWAMLDRAGGNLPCGDNMVVTTGSIMPLTTTPGKYILRTTVRYQVNPLRYFHEDYDTPPFMVVR